MKGIIITSEYEVNGNSLRAIEPYINPDKLRQYLLYWDKIDFVNNNILDMNPYPEVEYLFNAGVLRKTNYGMIMNDTTNFEKINLYMQINTFIRNNNNSNDEIWSIAQPTRKLILPIEKSIKTRTLSVELYNSIPVPTAEVNLEDILNFKERRHDELQEFRCVMDEMYLSIISSPDKDLAKDMYVTKLQNKLIELDKIMNESKMQRFLSSVKVELDIKNFAISGMAAVGGYGLGTKIGFPMIGAMFGFASSMLSVKYESSLKPKEIPKELKDYAYLYYQKKELR